MLELMRVGDEVVVAMARASEELILHAYGLVNISQW